MKICLLSYRGEPFCGGQGVYIHYLSKGLRDLGHEVHVLSGPPHPVVVPGIQVHELDSMDMYSLPPWRVPPRPRRLLRPLNMYEFLSVITGGFPEPFTFSMRAYAQLRGRLRAERFDVIHDNQCLGYGLLLMKRLGLPVVATIHHPVFVDRDIDIARADGWWLRTRMRRWYSFLSMQHRVARRTDRVIVVSRNSAKDTASTFGLHKSNIRVVYNGVDSEVFKRDESVARVPDSLVVVGGASHIKGLSYLLEAIHLLRDQRNVSLTIVGQPPLDGQFPSSLIRDYGLEGRVRFTGRVDREELVRCYSAAEVAVVPSLYEGFGFPAAEAMSCEVPLISTRGGALPEVAGEDGETAMLVPPGDAGAMAAAIRRLLADEVLRRRLGEQGRKRVETHFTWREAASKTAEVYQELL